MARATMLAMKMGRNKGKDWREMLEEELAKKKGGGGVKLEMEDKGNKKKMMPGFLVLEMRSCKRMRVGMMRSWILSG